MKLLMVMNVPYTRPHGGANRSNRALAEALSVRGHQVVVVTPALASPSPITLEEWRSDLKGAGVASQIGEFTDCFVMGGVEVKAVHDSRKTRGKLVEAARTLRPDWVLVASEDPSQSLLEAALEASPGRVAYLALTPQLFPFGPESLYPGKARAELVRRCALVACLSRAAAEYIREHSGLTAHVYHPPHFGTGPYPHFQNARQGAVFLMNASAVKGLPIFLDLARAFPSVPFAAVPGYATTPADRRSLADIANVSLWRNEAHLDDLFRRTRVLLMPSLWMESFGLAVADAMLRGIPVLAADHGALPEAKLGTDYVLPVRPITAYRDELGEDLLPLPIVPEQDVRPWRLALEELLGDEGLYRRQSDAARAAALRFVDGLSVEPFERLLINHASPRAVVDVPPPTFTPDRAQQPSAVGVAAGLTPQQKASLILELRKKSAGSRSAGSAGAPAIPHAPRDGPLPVSFAQEQLVFLDRLEPGSAAYNCPSAVRLEGNHDPAVLKRALAAIVARHESLRTRFDLVDGRPVQIVDPDRGLEMPLVDLSASPDDERRDRLESLIRQEARRPFDLKSGPLFRVSLIRLTPAEHVLFLNLHHIVTDGWSSGVFFNELGVLYRAFLRGEPSPLRPLVLQYADYAVWQRRELEGATLSELVSYWKGAISGAPAVLELPTDRPRPPLRGRRGDFMLFRVSAELTPRLKALSLREGATLFMTTLSAFSVLLHRLGGQTDIVVGAPIANRSPAETESMIGFFVNTLPIRTDLSGNPRFERLLRRVRGATLEALAHESLPFEKLIEELAPERSSSHSPVFQVLFVFHNTRDVPPDLDGLRATPLRFHNGTSKFDLNMELYESENGLEGSLEFDTDLFDPPTIERLLEAWQTLLAAIAARPGDPISELPLVSPAQSQEVLRSLNPRRIGDDGAGSVIGLFRRQASRTPDAAALFFGEESLTYGELDRRSNRLANVLIEVGIGTERAVGICLNRSFDLVVAVLATLKAGGICVPLDPAYPADRLDFMTDESAASVVLAHDEFAGRFRGKGPRVVVLDEPDPQFLNAPATDPLVPLPPESLLYILYTSGSTGRPKGVQLSHRALMNLICWHMDKFPNAARTLQYASLSFDASFHEIFAALATGGTLHLITENDRRDITALLRLIRSQRIEKAIFPVVVLHHLAERCAAEAGNPVSLREVISTGEQLKVTPAVAEWLRREPEISLHNDYGPTESHVVTSIRVSDRADLWAPLPPIGRPIRNSRTYILDRYLNLVPHGLSGELYLAGDCLARGYHTRPALTAERFVPDPFSPEPGGRMYRTGDLARVGTDGQLRYLGRLDEQLKIRGLRIEPGEVEAALRTFAGLEDCLVIAREDRPGDKRLVAYLVSGGLAAPPVAALRAHLSTILPDYMIPGSFVTLRAFPLTSNGKIDRALLPVPVAESQSLGDDSDVPRTDVERRLSAIWAEVLGVPAVGLRENFFVLGGHSILMIRVGSRIHDAFGVEISIQSFFEGPTVGQQSAFISGLMSAQGDQDGVEDLLARIESMDDAEAARLLSAAEDEAAPSGRSRWEAEVRRSLRRDRRSLPQPSAIAGFGIPSSNRAEVFGSALRSFGANFRRHDRRIDVTISSTPRNAVNDRAYRAVLERFQAEFHLPTWYAGPTEVGRFIRELTRSGDIPDDVIRFALTDTEGAGRSFGVNRNTLLLHHAGTLFITADDDTVADFHGPPEPRAGVAFCTESGVSEIRHLGKGAPLGGMTQPYDADLVALHEGVLGATVAETLARRTPEGLLDLTRARDSRLPGLAEGRGRILATYLGSIGHSGWASPRDALFLTGESWRWLTRSEDDYREALRSHEIIRYVDRLTVSRSDEFFLFDSGFDARGTLPPFLPVHRREDVLFAFMLNRLTGENYLAHLPVMVAHRHSINRTDLAQETIDLAMLIEVAVDSIGPSTESEGDDHRLERIGIQIEEFGGLSPADFTAQVREALRVKFAGFFDELHRRLADCPPERSFWARDMRPTLDLLRRSLDDRGPHLPLKFAPALNPEDSQAEAQRLMSQYGRLVRFWPIILAATRDLRARGIRPGGRVSQ